MGKALGYKAFGNAGVQEFFERPDPRPGPSEVLVRVAAAGVNPLDHKLRSGHGTALNGHVPFPQVLGMEAAGTVLAVGDGVTGLGVRPSVWRSGCSAVGDGVAVASRPERPALVHGDAPNGDGSVSCAVCCRDVGASGRDGRTPRRGSRPRHRAVLLFDPAQFAPGEARRYTARFEAS